VNKKHTLSWVLQDFHVTDKKKIPFEESSWRIRMER